MVACSPVHAFETACCVAVQSMGILECGPAAVSTVQDLLETLGWLAVMLLRMLQQHHRGLCRSLQAAVPSCSCGTRPESDPTCCMSGRTCDISAGHLLSPAARVSIQLQRHWYGRLQQEAVHSIINASNTCKLICLERQGQK